MVATPSQAVPKVVVVMPAYNAGRTLRMTYEELPKDTVNLVILVDDGSTDATLEVASDLGLEIFIHDKNYGYGANQKTCYTEALKAGADIVVMVHPDYQYDPTLVPQIIAPIARGEADLVLGSRLAGGGSAIEQGMPWWKYAANRFLTGVENAAFALAPVRVPHWLPRIQEGRARRRQLPHELRRLRLRPEIVAQVVATGFRIAEIPVPVRYFPEASSASFSASCIYGFKILWVVARYLLHRTGIKRSRRLGSIAGRYSRLGRR